jgi:RNA polymerase sigma-70 factor (ECF subfamily)
MREPVSSEPRPPSTVDDTVLVQGLKRGEEWAFEALVRVYGARMLATARRLVGNEEDARDVVQSAYLNAFRAIGQFEGSAQLSTWLHRIVVNTALMRLRSRRRKPEESIEPLLPAFKADGHFADRFSSVAIPADELLSRQETRRMVRRAIDQLPEMYRTVLVLRDIEELSTREVAEALEITPSAVKVRLHRARQGLFTLLRKELLQ